MSIAPEAEEQREGGESRSIARGRQPLGPRKLVTNADKRKHTDRADWVMLGYQRATAAAAGPAGAGRHHADWWAASDGRMGQPGALRPWASALPAGTPGLRSPLAISACDLRDCEPAPGAFSRRLRPVGRPAGQVGRSRNQQNRRSWTRIAAEGHRGPAPDVGSGSRLRAVNGSAPSPLPRQPGIDCWARPNQLGSAGRVTGSGADRAHAHAGQCGVCCAGSASDRPAAGRVDPSESGARAAALVTGLGLEAESGSGSGC